MGHHPFLWGMNGGAVKDCRTKNAQDTNPRSTYDLPALFFIITSAVQYPQWRTKSKPRMSSLNETDRLFANSGMSTGDAWYETWKGVEDMATAYSHIRLEGCSITSAAMVLYPLTNQYDRFPDPRYGNSDPHKADPYSVHKVNHDIVSADWSHIAAGYGEPTPVLQVLNVPSMTDDQKANALTQLDATALSRRLCARVGVFWTIGKTLLLFLRHGA